MTEASSSGRNSEMKDDAERDRIRDEVRKRYAETADSCGCGGTSCCSPSGGEAASASERLGYKREELEKLPVESNMGLGCGNPLAIASLEEGETVVDLGCGGGIDCFLASMKVGDTGKVIGIDMTPEMLLKARQGASEGGFVNVEFRLGEIEHLPVADGTVDVIISNCVINLSPDKPQVLREAYRVLKKGGRLAVSDVVTVAELPEQIRGDLDALAGCVAGAVRTVRYEEMLIETGFSEIDICVDESSAEFIRDWFPGTGIERYVRSAKIEAVK
jgi:SAM-dependent methyltransferase